MQLTGNTILITGGGSGIGRGLAEAFHKLGNKVIIAGRRKDVLDQTTSANPGMSSIPLDIDDPAAILAFAKKVVAEHPALNVLINNSGIMRLEDLVNHPEDLSVPEATITTNLLGPIRLTSALLPHLTKQSHPVIMNVTSGLAFAPLAFAPVYCGDQGRTSLLDRVAPLPIGQDGNTGHRTGATLSSDRAYWFSSSKRSDGDAAQRLHRGVDADSPVPTRGRGSPRRKCQAAALCR